MFRFERSSTVKHVDSLPVAAQFAAEVSSYLNKRYALNLKTGVEMFGAPSVHWYYDFDSLDKQAQLNATLMQDRDYLAMINKTDSLWVEGSVKDTVVSLLG